MKYLISAAIISGVVLSSIGSASALPPPTQTITETICASVSNGGDAPMGTYEDANGRKWAGLKAGGLPPDSLSSGGSQSTSCTTTTYEVHVPI